LLVVLYHASGMHFEVLWPKRVRVVVKALCLRVTAFSLPVTERGEASGMCHSWASSERMFGIVWMYVLCRS
jgi:hypothetical protein